MGYLLPVFGRHNPCARKPLFRITLLTIGAMTACLAAPDAATAASSRAAAFSMEKFARAGVRKEALQAAFKAYAARREQVKRPFLALIDYALHSSKPRLFIIDMRNGKMKSYRVAHGKGSDPENDGFADRFSNVPDSKMSSLGAFITANAYYGKHGLSLRLIGLDKSNNAALTRAIVMHGAKYVSARRGVGRSWGCPSIEKRYVKEVIPELANGAFLYITH